MPALAKVTVTLSIASHQSPFWSGKRTSLHSSRRIHSEMRSSRVVPALVALILLIVIIMLRTRSHHKAESRLITAYRRTHIDSQQPTEEVQSVETEEELQDLPTSTEIQTDTAATEAHTTPKPVNPAVELTLIRRTSVDKVRLVRGP